MPLIAILPLFDLINIYIIIIVLVLLLFVVGYLMFIKKELPTLEFD